MQGKTGHSWCYQRTGLHGNTSSSLAACWARGDKSVTPRGVSSTVPWTLQAWRSLQWIEVPGARDAKCHSTSRKYRTWLRATFVTKVVFSSYQNIFGYQKRLEKRGVVTHVLVGAASISVQLSLNWQRWTGTQSIEGDFKESVWLERIKKWAGRRCWIRTLWTAPEGGDLA